MGPPKRDVAWEYARQKERLDLLAEELQIQGDEKEIESKRAEEKELQDNIKAIESSIRSLENQWSNWSSQWGWRSRTVAKQKFQLLGIKSKLKKQRADKLKVQKKILDTSEAIRTLECSVSAAKGDIERVKSTYRFSWSDNEDCCNARSEELSVVLGQLAISKAESSTAKEELKTVKATLELCNEQNEKYARDWSSIEMKLQTANQKIQRQCTTFKVIRMKLGGTHQDIQKLLSEEEFQKEYLLEVPQHTDNVAPQSLALSRTTDHAPISRSLEDVIHFMNSITDLVKHVEIMRETVFEAIKDTVGKLKAGDSILQQHKDRIEQMLPLYQVGLDIRQRKFEIDMKHIKDSRPNWDLVNMGNDAAHHGHSLADAMMFQDFCEDRRQYPEEFEDQYNKVPAEVVWKHREFTMFHDMLSWHMNMRQFQKDYGVKSTRFDELFELFFSKIYPSFKVASNEDINKDLNLKQAYNWLSKAHGTAYKQVIAIRKKQRREDQKQ